MISAAWLCGLSITTSRDRQGVVSTNRFLTVAARVALIGLLLVCGCIPRRDLERPHIVYDGPTLSIHEIVEKINQNNQQIPTLRANGDFQVWFHDDNNATHFVNGDATLLYRRGRDLRLTGTKVALGRVFDVGSNAETYWLVVKPEVDTLWRGSYDKPSPRLQIPIRPDLLIEVLGVGSINSDLRAEPMPVMKFNNDQDVYMITWHAVRPDRVIAQKEVWYDRQTLRPKLVSLFDDSGRIVLRAYLNDFRPIAIDGVDQSHWPVAPGSYDLYFPDTKTKMIFSLNELKLSENGFPKDASFRAPPDSSAAKVIDLDESSGR